MQKLIRTKETINLITSAKMVHSLIDDSPAVVYLGNVGTDDDDFRRAEIAGGVGDFLEASLSPRR